MTTEKQLTCAERVERAKASRMDDLKCLYRPGDCSIDALAGFLEDQGREVSETGEPYTDEDMENIYEQLMECQSEYGLAFDYVPHDGGYNDSPGYFRYQISYGGPSEELRFYADPDLSLYKTEFWFLDWFDGAPLTLRGDDAETAQAIFDDFKEIGVLENEIEKTTE